MNILLLCRYSRDGASSRLRLLQYLPVLERTGVHVTSSPLSDDSYLRRLYGEKRRSLTGMARGYFNRVCRMCRAGKADLIWLEKEALPYLPFWLEHRLMPSGVPYIVDYDDAVFHNYDLSDNTLVRRLLGQKIDRVMAGAATVICGNGYLADRAEQAGAKRVERVPTVVNIERYTPVPVTSNASPVIGWIGSPSTQHYLLELRTVFERLHRLHGIRLVLVGATLELAQQFGSVPVDVLPWSEEMEAEHVAGFDIGIMPLRDGPWERGKCGYKLIQYMACAKPVVASPVGVNTEIVQGRDCGLLATSHEQWFSVITQLLNDTALRAELGKRGRVAVERHYSLQVQAPRMAKILCGAAAREP